MKTYVIQETIYREFEVLADSKEDAFRRLANEDIEPSEEWTDEKLYLVEVKDPVLDTADK